MKGLFSLFRKPRVTASYMDSDAYVRATPSYSPQLSELPMDELDVPTDDRTDEQSAELNEMFNEAAAASETDIESPRTFKPLAATSSTVYDQLLNNDLPARIRTKVQLRVLFARDHEAWGRTLENDLRDMSNDLTGTRDFQEALMFRTQQLRIRRDALQIAVSELAHLGCFKNEVEGLHEKIEAITEVLSN